VKANTITMRQEIANLATMGKIIAPKPGRPNRYRGFPARAINAMLGTKEIRSGTRR
jgi:hypothetical protein